MVMMVVMMMVLVASPNIQMVVVMMMPITVVMVMMMVLHKLHVRVLTRCFPSRRRAGGGRIGRPQHGQRVRDGVEQLGI